MLVLNVLHVVSLLLCLSVGVAEINDALIEWENITISTKDRTILSMGPGSIRKGRLVGVLGPSGCGKSTFLNVLGGMWKNTNNAFTKDVQMVTSLSSDQIAVVPQDYSFFEMLTVRETLVLSARIREVMDAGMAHDGGFKKDGHILEQVEHIMRNLSLLKVSNSQVGDPFNTRGISGGERKRLSIACELLGDEKKLVIADEPTSGLDSFQAQLTINLLRQLAIDKDIAVVCSIHQPRSAIWSMFDDIILLTPLGKIAYYGRRENIESYFNNLGYTIPLKTNPADFILDLVSIDTTSPARIEECTTNIHRLIAAAATHNAQKVKSRKSLQDTIAVTKTTPSFSRNPFKLMQMVGSKAKRSCTRFLLLLQRAGRQAIRDNATNLVRILISGCLAWIVGSVNGKQANELFSDSVGDRINIIAQGAINVGMLAMIKTLQLFKRERSVIERERSHQQYSAFEYLLAKMCAELPLDALVAAVFGLVLQEKANLRCGRKSIVSVLALLGCASSTLGLAIGSICPTGDVALAVGPALMVIYVVIGAIGPGSTDKSLPRFLQPLRYASPFRWACEALSVAELQGQTFHTARTEAKANPFKVMKSITSALFSGVAGRLVKGKPGIKRDGDHALEALGLKNKVDNTYAVQGLSNMIMIHSLVALVGLWFQT